MNEGEREVDSAGNFPAESGPMLGKVPREYFIPDQAWVKENGDYEPIDRESDSERWFAAVHSDRAIVTQFDDGMVRWPEVGDRPTCSASMPSVVSGMLDALDVGRGHRVLEIGTGTGFNAALLAEIVAAPSVGSVTTVEVDAVLAAIARKNLDSCGYHGVDTVVGDGAAGLSELDPCDRIVVTAGVQMGRLPYAWVDKTRNGGTILAPMRGDLSSGPLVRFTVRQDGVAVGRAVPMGVGFMELRAQRTPRATDDQGVRWDDPAAEVSSTDVDAEAVLGDPHARWALTVALPSCRYDVDEPNDDRATWLVWLRDPLSGSWASITPDGDAFTVHQAGPRRLWTEAEHAYRWWRGRGQPAVGDWKWTITPERQSITLE